MINDKLTCPSHPPETKVFPSLVIASAEVPLLCVLTIVNANFPESGVKARMHPSSQPIVIF